MKRITAVLLALSILLSLPLTLHAADQGMTFEAGTVYKSAEPLSQVVRTFEAVISVPNGLSGRGGVIFGNYGSEPCCISFEIYSNGNPRLYLVTPSGAVIDKVFTGVDLRDGKVHHLAIVIDGPRLYCYIDGNRVQSLSIEDPNVLPTVPLVLGGDLRSGNAQYFKGTIYSACAYADIRMVNEIVADVSQPGRGDPLFFYDLSTYAGTDRIEDGSENGFSLSASRTWFSEKEEVTDYAYSIAVVGDTQIICESHPTKMDALYDWLMSNVEKKKIAAVLGMGDITNSSTDKEWALAEKNIHKLDGLVPYTLVRGNHDTSRSFNRYFPYSDFAKRLTSYDGKMENTYTTLTAGLVDYLILCLDYGASDAVLSWASGVIEAHPKHNVIITTHAYLYRDGTTLDQGDVCPPATTGGSNNGDHIWEKLIRKHANITLVLSGHDPCDRVVVTQTKGDHGNTVTQMLVDPQGVDAAQGGTGMVTMLYFSQDGKNVTVETYSTAKKQFFMTENQFEMVIDSREKAPETTAVLDPTEAPDETLPETDGDAGTRSGCGSVLSLPVPIALAACTLLGDLVKSRKKANDNRR